MALIRSLKCRDIDNAEDCLIIAMELKVTKTSPKLTYYITRALETNALVKHIHATLLLVAMLRAMLSN